MYHLYYTLESAAMGSHAALEEIDAPFELHHVDLLNPYLLGADFSVCDLYLHTLSRWNPTDYPRFADYPNAARCAALVAARPAVQRMMAVQCPEAA